LACNKQMLLLHGTMYNAFLQYVRRFLEKPLAMVIFVLEEKHLLWTYFHSDITSDLRDLWMKFVTDLRAINIESIPEPKGIECYKRSNLILHLKFPFSFWLVQHLGTYKNIFLEDTARLENDCSNLTHDSQLSPQAIKSQKLRLRELVDCSLGTEVATAFRKYSKLYLDDFLILKNPVYAQSKGVLEMDLLRHIILCFFNSEDEDSDDSFIQSTIPHILDLFLCCWQNERIITSQLQLVLSCQDLVSISLHFWDCL
jgi:hypothetical protein